MGWREEHINEEIKTMAELEDIDTNLISDGYHTFGELYDHRIILYLSLLTYMELDGFDVYGESDFHFDVYWSDTHHDGSKWDGWLIVGCTDLKTNEQISYHISDNYRYLLEDWEFEYLERAPEWDGHTSEDVLDRLVEWIFEVKRKR